MDRVDRITIGMLVGILVMGFLCILIAGAATLDGRWMEGLHLASGALIGWCTGILVLLVIYRWIDKD